VSHEGRIPTYRLEDAVAPYKDYSCSATLYVLAGGLQLPLAYTTPTAGAPLPTSRLFQGHEPTCALAIEWYGVRTRLKPEPPRLLVFGDFLLHSAAARCDGVSKEANGTDVISASGYFLLFATTRPEHVVVPSLWTPYDGRYNTTVDTVAQYLYTPDDLGFGDYLPDQGDSAPTYGNPLLSEANSGGNKILGENP
jgi:hypothetical protein